MPKKTTTKKKTKTTPKLKAAPKKKPAKKKAPTKKKPPAAPSAPIIDPHAAHPIDGEILDVDMELIDEPTQDVRSYISAEHIDGLAESLQAIGLIHEPILTRTNGRFEIVSGHCRFLAARKLGWSTLRSKVVDREEVDREFMKLHENMYRQDLSAVEKAQALHINKTRFGLTDDDLARRFGHSRPWVTRILGALSWPEDLQQANADGVLGFEVCDVLRKIKSDDHRAMLIRYAVSDGCSKRLAHEWYNEWLRNERIKESLRAREQDPETSDLVRGDDELAEDARRQQLETVHRRVAAMRKRCNMCGGEHPMDSLLTWDLCGNCIGVLNHLIEQAKAEGLIE